MEEQFIHWSINCFFLHENLCWNDFYLLANRVR